MKIMTKAVTLLLAAVFCLGLIPILPAAAKGPAVIDSGTCGENVTWKLTDDGTLTIRGEGDIMHYADGSFGPIPWREHQDNGLIKKLVVECDNEMFNCTVTMQVKNTDEVNQMIRNIRTINGVGTVNRI